MSKSKNVVKKLTTILFTILFTLVSVFAIGPTNVNAETTDITEINLTGNYQYGTVPAGILPAFNPGTTTDSITIDRTNSSWEYKMKSGGWSGFGLETPVAYNDGKTDYGYSFAVDTKEGYQLASDLKVIYNGEDVTSTVKVTRWAWGAYVDVDLGKAIGENPTTHTVTFNSNGGTEIAPKEVVSGLKIKAPSTPTKDKYVFRGWYEDSTFSKEFDFNTLITSDMTLYANWEAANSINEIRLAGDIQYGTVQVGTLPSFNPGTTTDSITIDKTNSGWMKRTSTTSLWGGFASNTPVAYNDGKTNYGYDFCVNTNDGYQLASDLKVIYNGDDVTTTANVSRWAWGAYVTVDLGKANGTPVVYTITFNSNDGTPVAPQNINAGEKLKEPTPAPTREGFTFDGWYEDSTFSKKFDFNTPITDSMTLYAKWTENKYTLTFDANGGTGSMTAIADLTGEYILPSNEFTAPSGKQFKGWSLTTDGAIVTKVDMTENRTVYAIWENIPVVTYTVSFAANGGTGTMTAATGISGNYTLPACTFTAPAGKQFKAWSVGGVEKAVGDKITVTANTTVTAVWEPIPVTTYDLTTQVNGGHGTISASKTGLTAGSTETITFTPDAGYKIDTVTVNGTATSVSGNTLNVTMNENKTVVVTYKAIEYNITVTDGKATIGAGSEISKAAEGTAVTLTANAVPSGKVFDKWEVVSGGITLADANSATTTFTMPASAVSVKATYKNAPHTHTYNQETVKPEALKTPADCTSNAVYFKSCSCGAISTTDTFVAMNTALGHAYGSDWKYDSTNHWHECSRCHDKKDEAAHDYGSDNVCDTCGYDKTVPHTHNLTLVAAKAATCTEGGKEAYYKCEGCGKFYEDVLGTKEITDLASWGNIAKIAHTTKQTVTKATPTANGKIVNYCSVCKKTLSTTVIPKASSIKLKATSLTYNGKVRTPKVIVKDRTGKTLVKNTDYTVSYAKGRKYVGKYAVKITFKGKYSGTKTLYFTIKPKATSISSLTAGSKKFTVKWKKQATQTTGYQVQYSASSKFSKAKTVTVGKNTTVSKKISKLSGKKKYYVRVRTYKTVKINGKSIRIYSGWSKAKTVTTKK
ncbi:InlB B-repeat-containing protein [Eubacterium ventriosum]|nr:InlB B-repeat-containing protein [Eubacterium ventriosum]